MSFQVFSLSQLGWRPQYAQNLSLDDFEAGYPARVVAVHRNGLAVLSSRGYAAVVLPTHLAESETAVAVGDWVLVEHEADRVWRLLERQSLIACMAVGHDHRRQAIAANLDTLFVVTSCNEDFNTARLERYLALAFDTGVIPVVVLTKTDLGADVDSWLATAQGLLPGVAMVAVNATDSASAAQLSSWLSPGKTVAFVGSSGVGKSTLIHQLIAGSAQRTGDVRERDAKGQHTTTTREMFPTASGAWVIDTPGMRELRSGTSGPDLSAVFQDSEAPAQCSFHDCQHESDANV